MHLLNRNKWLIWLGISPSLIVYTLFCMIPIGISFYYSFQNWDGFSDPSFIGLDNFAALMKDQVFWSSLKNNMFVLLASVLGQIPIALLFALLLNSKLRGAKFFRTVGFLPVAISTVIISLTWNMIYNTQYGLINTLLKAVGLDHLAHNWLGDPKWAMLAVCLTIIWQYVGLYLVIFLAALQNVPAETLEAAEIDGATGFVKTVKIIIPMIWGTILVSVILCISGSLKTFDLIYVMTNGGPAHTTDVMAIYMFNKTFSSFQYGYGSAISVAIFVVSLLLISVASRLLKAKED
ncbi:carbohydrate ABC transporter permease [Paenibacillus radicis (ex Gao et al. 2016)]|uniref:ABC transporter permease n=1 Tax=Paenibacillus radicis (ex Gao et al. 2016) TaxID=1737354 RepID=A0A917HMN2_9BACL|nr:sugar ABC transporter permease [Paenibacillus radicis (ex Gao et al. 2016)]GGG83742.1 ABC transporter permease [Paenibacillus radicis (ex Gao et al. 2016)]